MFPLTGLVRTSPQPEQSSAAFAFLLSVEARGIGRKHPVLELGGRPRICTIPDPDGNEVRIYADP